MKLTKREAVEKMVKEFDAMNLEIFERAFIGKDYEYFDEMTQVSIPTEGAYALYPESGYIKEITEDNKVKIENSDILYDIEEVEIDLADEYPTWGTVWNIRNVDYLVDYKDLIELGFIVFDTDFGTIIGLNSGGHDFYEAYWTPLYDRLGLKWHTVE